MATTCYISMKLPTRKKVMYGIATLVVAGLWSLGSFELAVLGTFAVICFVGAVPGHIVGVAAISLLGLVAVLQLVPALEGYSEQLAMYVFYLLCIVVGLQMRHLGEDKVIEPVRRKGLDLDLRRPIVTLQTFELAQNNDTKEKPSLTNTTSEKMWDINVKMVRKPPVI